MRPPRRTVAAVLALSFIMPAPAARAASYTLHWTASGDDGEVGTAALYDLRYAYAPIDTTNFDIAVSVPGLPPPQPAGSPESFTVDNLPDGVAVYFALKVRDKAGNWSGISNVIERGEPLATPGGVPALAFSAPQPNPARSLTRFRYSLPAPGEVRVEAFDLAGRSVRVLASGARPAGAGEIAWRLDDAGGRPLPAGVYLVRARLGHTVWTRRLVVTR